MNKIKIKLKQNQKVTFRLNVKMDDAPILQNKTVIPLKKEQIVKADIGVYGLKEVIVKAIPYAEYENTAGGKTVVIGG